MGISYDPPSKKWNVSYEKTNYKTDHRTDYPTDLSVNNTKTKWYFGTKMNAGAGGKLIEVKDTDKNQKNAQKNKDKKRLDRKSVV